MLGAGKVALCSARNRIIRDFLLTVQAATLQPVFVQTAQDRNSEHPVTTRNAVA